MTWDVVVWAPSPKVRRPGLASPSEFPTPSSQKPRVPQHGYSPTRDRKLLITHSFAKATLGKPIKKDFNKYTTEAIICMKTNKTQTKCLTKSGHLRRIDTHFAEKSGFVLTICRFHSIFHGLFVHNAIHRRIAVHQPETDILTGARSQKSEWSVLSGCAHPHSDCGIQTPTSDSRLLS